MADLEIRLIRPNDDFAELTDLLHRAYGVLAARGMKFLASHQDEKMTRERAAKGECYVALKHREIIGTIVWRNSGQTKGAPWYDRPDVASFGQFAVDPGWQGRGIGTNLVALAERRSAESGAAELALDTAEPATNLIDFYTKRGYRFIDYTRWDGVNYRSLILSKRIDRAVRLNGFN